MKVCEAEFLCLVNHDLSYQPHRHTLIKGPHDDFLLGFSSRKKGILKYQHSYFQENFYLFEILEQNFMNL